VRRLTATLTLPLLLAGGGFLLADTTRQEQVDERAAASQRLAAVQHDAWAQERRQATAARAIAEEEAARLGLTVSWGWCARGMAATYSQHKSQACVSWFVTEYTPDQIRTIIRHEAGHANIEWACGTYWPPIVGDEPEPVADAYADMYLGGLTHYPYGYTQAHADIAAAIHAGDCGFPATLTDSTGEDA
jgi:hypothetical protein